MHLRITNSSTQAFDAFPFVFGSAGALELTNEYSGLAAVPAPILASQSSSKHVPMDDCITAETDDEPVSGDFLHGLRWD